MEWYVWSALVSLAGVILVLLSRAVHALWQLFRLELRGPKASIVTVREPYPGEAVALAEIRQRKEPDVTPKEVEAARKDRERENVLRRQQEGETFARFLEQCRRTEEILERVNERKEQPMTSEPKSPTPTPKAGVTVEATIKPTDDQKRRHESYWRIKQACLAMKVSVPREIEEYFASAPDAEQLKEIPCAIDPVVLAEKDGISIRFAAQAVQGAGVVKVLVPNVLVFEGPAKPFEQPHDGQMRIAPKTWCSCTRCCRWRGAILGQEAPITEEEYRQ